MAQGLSSTVLPADKVSSAALAASVALAGEKAKLKDRLIMEYRARHGAIRWAFKTNDALWDNMPEEIKKIVELYRVSDGKVLMALHGLATAALTYHEDFTVQMTADDFRLIQNYYSP